MEVKKMDGRSMDLQQHYIEVLAKHLPEVVHEGKVDMEQLVLILGEKQETADAEERYRFTWAGKREAIRASQRPSMGTLLPDREGSSNWDTTQNLYIEGDNLEVLKLLQKSYFEQVKMIYIDPPYNTGKDFVYPDNFKSPLANYFEVTGQVDGEGHRLTSNTETSGRYHSDWLNMIYPRLRLARNLLRDDGVIFISIDDNEVHNLRKVCDEIFGEENFLAQLPTVMNLKGNQDQFGFAGTHEYTIVYTKNIEQAIVGEFAIEDQKEKALWKSDKKGFFKKGAGLISTGVNSPRSSRPALWFPVFITKDLNIKLPAKDVIPTFYDEETKSFKDDVLYAYIKEQEEAGAGKAILPLVKGREASWRWSYDKMEAEIDDIIVSKNGNSYSLNKKQRPKSGDVPNRKPKTLFYDPKYSSGNGTRELENLLNHERLFDNPKPVKLIYDFLQVGMPEYESIVLDFFSGSATTAHAVMQLNAEDGGKRRFIMVQLPEPTPEGSEARKARYKTISQIGMKRIQRAGAKIQEEHPLLTDDLDTGFRLFRLDTSNISTWMTEAEREKLHQKLSTEQERPEALEYIQQRLLESVDNIVEKRSEEDLLYELALKMGLDLSSSVKKRKSQKGQDIFVVGEGALMICLGDDITWDIAEDLIALHKEFDPVVCHFIFKDNGFVDDKAKTNTIESLKSAGFPAQVFTTV